MENVVYFVRHARPDLAVQDDRTRPLTPRGRADARRLAGLLEGRGIRAVYSSPYRRCLETIEPFAVRAGLPVRRVEDFRERAIASWWVEDFSAFAARQWADFDYALPGGESLRQVEERCSRALEGVLREMGGGVCAVSTHGTALSVMLHHLNPSFSYESFLGMVGKTPWVIRVAFGGPEGEAFSGMEELPVEEGEGK